MFASSTVIIFLNDIIGWNGWNFIQAISTVIALIIAFWASYQSIRIIKKQLEIEQEPGVVVEDKIILKGQSYQLSMKNVGRGSAYRVTCSLKNEIKYRDDAFFSNSEPHSRNLFPNENVYWKFDKNKLDTPDKNNSNNKECYFTFYIFYESQLGNIYRTKVKIKFLGEDFVVMENKIQKIKNYG